MKPSTNRRTLLVSLVLATLPALPGCGVTAWQRGQDGIIVTAGSSICTGPEGELPSNGKCAAMEKIGQSLHTGQLARDIEAARMK